MGISMNNFFEVGHPFDAVVYKTKMPLFFEGRKDNLLSSILYTGDSSAIYGTMTNGRWIVKGHRHEREAEIRKNFLKAIRELYP